MRFKAQALGFVALVVACWGASAAAQATDTASASSQRLLELMQPKPAQVSVARLAEREQLLRSGEAALARLQVPTAQDAFDRAALILHAADTEMALVRSYMQGGEYRRALAFGAHTAGAHLDVASGSALYAWLLHAGGQGLVAQRLLSQAQARMPTNTVIAQVQQQLKSAAPRADGELLKLPLRLAPYGSGMRLPANAQLLSSGVLLPGGKHALVPLVALRSQARGAKLWLRNGLGQMSAATRERALPAAGVALLRLANPLPVSSDLQLASRDAFAGSVGYALEYVAALAGSDPKHNADPAWPWLYSGFLGALVLPQSAGKSQRQLGIDLPAGARGGPVFNAAGQLAGIALAGGAGQADQLSSVTQWQPLMQAQKPGAPPARQPPQKQTAAAADAIYEIGLKTALQLIVARPQ